MIKTIIYIFMNRITTNITLHKCLFCCFRCATLIITLSHKLSYCVTICWFRPINAYSVVTAYNIILLHVNQPLY